MNKITKNRRIYEFKRQFICKYRQKTLFLSDDVDNESIGKLTWNILHDIEVTKKFCKRRFSMNKMVIEKANKLIRSQQCLNDLRQIVIYPYPGMFSKRKHDQKTGFCYNGDYVSFAHLDDVTKDKLKAAILTVIDDRYNELNDEIDKL